MLLPVANDILPWRPSNIQSEVLTDFLEGFIEKWFSKPQVVHLTLLFLSPNASLNRRSTFGDMMF